MPLSDEVRQSLSDAIAGKNEIKFFIAARLPRKSALRLFAEQVAVIDKSLQEKVEGWTISYSLDPVQHDQMRSRSDFTGNKAPVIGVIKAVSELEESTRVGIQKLMSLLEMYPADLEEIIEEILSSDALPDPRPTHDELRTGGLLCIKLDYAFDNGGAAGCTASVCPPD